MQPLEGITVVSLEQAVAAPFATRQLADLGARVIKIERPGVGDFARAYDVTVHGMSSHFVWLNRSKQSLTLDLKRPEARDVLNRLIGRADVFVQNLAPGASDRLKLGSANLRQKYPKLIVCNMSGYGSSGPYRDRKAYDLLVQAEAGLVSITGTKEAPSKVGISVADIAAGMYGYSGILTALLTRNRTGKGSSLEVSMFEALGEWMGYAAYYTSYGGLAPKRTGASHAAIAPYGPFSGSDGEAVYLGVQNEREWVLFCNQVLGRPELANDDRFRSNINRVHHQVELNVEITDVFKRMSTVEIIEKLESARIAYARMSTVKQFIDHPQLSARERWREVESPVGSLWALLPPVSLEGIEPIMGSIPDIGQHTDVILEELGYGATTISNWRKAKIV